jgi:type IV pilus biogenesis protein CpaD/CtpE
MTRTFHRSVLAAALAAAALAGCAFQPIGTFERADYRVQAAQGIVDLRFVPGTAELDTGEAARLAEFVQGLALRNWDDVLLTFGPSGSGALDGARLEATRRAVAEAAAPVRLNVVTTRNASRLNPNADSVLVEALRNGQLLVACPSAYADSIDEAYASRLPSMTCSNAANLAYMAATPRDLIDPRALGPSDGATSSAAVIRYRQDRIKEPDAVSSAATE